MAPKDATYKLEVWGAQGGDADSKQDPRKYAYAVDAYMHGGNGGYSKGYGKFKLNQSLFVAVGQQGASNKYHDACPIDGAFNGGGNILQASIAFNHLFGGGGGASHIALNENLGVLSNYVNSQDLIIIVAGGGGGAHIQPNDLKDAEGGSRGNGGEGGGLIGFGSYNTQTVDDSLNEAEFLRATQTGGYNFGLGNLGYTEASGGGGWYGGLQYTGQSNLKTARVKYGINTAGAGGSGHINSTLIFNGTMQSGIRKGNGYAIVTLIH